MELYEAMEEDLERIDDIGSFVRRYLKKGMWLVVILNTCLLQ